MTLIAVDEIARRLNNLAELWAPKLLPNGHRSGNYWMASGIADTGKSASLYVHLAGEKVGQWADQGNARAGEEFGDMLDLLRLKHDHASVADAVGEAKFILGIVDEPPRKGELSADERVRRDAEFRRLEAESKRALAEQQQKSANERAAKIRGAKSLYLAGVGIEGTPVEWYLRNRLIEPVTVQNADAASWPGVLRYHPEVWCGDERVKVPAMLAAMYLVDGSQVAVHRTFLQCDERRGWRKLDTPKPKKVLGPMHGAFVPINKGETGVPMGKMPEGEAIYVTEGIENAVVVRMKRPQARIIAAGSLSNMGEIILPRQARRLVIVADRDPSEAAQMSLERVIGKQQARGMDVGIVMPPEGVNDFNDWLIQYAREQARRKPG